MTTQSWNASCQCGAIAFTFEADLSRTLICNCSRCRRLGSVLTFVPAAAVTFIRDGSVEYRFNRKVIGHRFCPTCGIETHALAERNGTPMCAINVNCVDGVDARALDSKPVDGASF